MRASESSIAWATIAAVLWHTLAGCCFHHCHAQSSLQDIHKSFHPTDQFADTPHCCGSSHNHDGNSESKPEDETPDEDSPCNHPSECSQDRCVFATGRSTSTDLNPVQQVTLLSINNFQRTYVLPTTPAWGSRQVAIATAESPRIHLVFCVFLI
jgi:hypothetical protein